MSYRNNLIKGMLLSFGGICIIAYVSSVIMARLDFSSSIGGSLFFMLIVSPCEEIVFRFFVPLVLMYWFNLEYLVAGFISAIGFGFAHYWAYEQDMSLITVAIISGFLQSYVVWRFSRKEPFNFSPGLTAAILGHGLYDVVVTYDPGNLLVYGLGSLLLFTILYFKLPDEVD